jgi:hypothetical protein
LTPAANGTVLPHATFLEIFMQKAMVLFYIVFCLELGVLLFFLPWTAFWSRNYFVHHFPWIASATRNYFVRGAISGLGVADLCLAIHELWRFRRKLGVVVPRNQR